LERFPSLTKYMRKTICKMEKERFVLVHSFGGFGLWLLDLVAAQHIRVRVCGKEGMITSGWLRRKMRDRKGSRSQFPLKSHSQ
jgi:hypothetical protein